MKVSDFLVFENMSAHVRKELSKHKNQPTLSHLFILNEEIEYFAFTFKSKEGEVISIWNGKWAKASDVIRAIKNTKMTSTLNTNDVAVKRRRLLEDA